MARAKKEKQNADGKYVLKKKKDNKLGKGIMIAGSVIFLMWCAFSVASDKKDVTESKAILAELKAEEEALAAENAGYASIINEENERSYMERIAIELYGYAYPSERRFYDTTRS